MRKFQVRFGIAVFLLVALMVTEAAAVKITVKNDTGKDAFVAFMWIRGKSSHGASSGTVGWVNVPRWSTKVFNKPDLDGPALQVGYLGFYAVGYRDKKKQLTWQGKGTYIFGTGWIHPTKHFEMTNLDSPMSGSKKVNFCKFSISRNANGTLVGTISLTERR